MNDLEKLDIKMQIRVLRAWLSRFPPSKNDGSINP